MGTALRTGKSFHLEHRKLTRPNVPAMNDFRVDVYLLAGTKGESLKSDFDNMSVEELWLLREQNIEMLGRRIAQEKRELERRLSLLRGNLGAKNTGSSARNRPYPKVLPKYRNPAEPAETWSGRGKRPKWVVAQLKSGKKLEDLAL
jgi:DNA-binding protein H-NS